MADIFPFLVPITLFVTIGAAVVLRGPIGKALSDRIAGRAHHGVKTEDTEALRVAVDDLSYRLGEVEERLDFTERVLARQREQRQLPGGE